MTTRRRGTSCTVEHFAEFVKCTTGPSFRRPSISTPDRAANANDARNRLRSRQDFFSRFSRQLPHFNRSEWTCLDHYGDTSRRRSKLYQCRSADQHAHVSKSMTARKLLQCIFVWWNEMSISRYKLTVLPRHLIILGLFETRRICLISYSVW